MPKDKTNPLSSSTRSSAFSPYSRPSENTDQCSSKSILKLVGDEGEWEDTICPICVEHPHNAVLLICSSHERGCRPYMCDTSSRHSNCFDQFRQTAPPSQSADIGEDFLRSSSIKKLENKVQCPLCRGKISGWVVVEAARKLMNSKSRNCSLESCEFSGTYKELREHARREHPSDRPTDIDPRRQQEWMRWESERTWEDLLGVAEVDIPIDLIDLLVPDDPNWEDDLRNLPSELDWEYVLRNLPFNLDFFLQLAQPGMGAYSSDMLDLDFESPLDSALPLDMPYILSSHLHLSGQELSIMSLLYNSTGDYSSGEGNSDNNQPQPRTNSNEDQVQPASNSNEVQVQPASNSNEVQVQPASNSNEVQVQPGSNSNQDQLQPHERQS